jgi:hypothetical protein
MSVPVGPEHSIGFLRISFLSLSRFGHTLRKPFAPDTDDTVANIDMADEEAMPGAFLDDIGDSAKLRE